jgi:hypothetical protein
MIPQEDTSMKKFLVALLFVAVIASGSFAQLMIGLSGALHMDERLTAEEINARFKSGDGIFYGPTIEIAGRHLGVGVTGNVSSYDRDVTFDSYLGPITQTFKFTDYDLTLYLSYHLFGGRAFLDPFGEFGGGVLAMGFAEDADNEAYNPYDGNFLMANYYWYAALGLGLNLGPIGVFGKFSFNYALKNADYKANWRGTETETTLYPYGYDEVLFPNGYLPKYRFTAGVKLIL